MKMRIQKIPIKKINPAPYNPRKNLKPDDAEYQKLKRSFDEFGYVDPLIWNKCTGNLVGGHQRLLILQAKGATEIEVSVVDLPIEKEKLLNIALNRYQANGTRISSHHFWMNCVKLPALMLSLLALICLKLKILLLIH